eukprot:TRINITY_DN4391_c0_g1_i4.p3 TRINITY_DN4391_c0_g1~~TRINITY_DN4391_c0_g1_i4.p3  ORF type:complete len:108 (-),score=21.55 TRINITY_DN4391_c0_g1_i4:190-513(-)
MLQQQLATATATVEKLQLELLKAKESLAKCRKRATDLNQDLGQARKQLQDQDRLINDCVELLKSVQEVTTPVYEPADAEPQGGAGLCGWPGGQPVVQKLMDSLALRT